MELKDAYLFLEKAGVYYLATVSDNEARVRPFGTVLLLEDKIYIQTGKIKEVSKQIEVNPNAEITAFVDGAWVRVRGNLVEDPRLEAKKAMLDKYPHLRSRYDENDGNTVVYYFEHGYASIESFTAPKQEVNF